MKFELNLLNNTREEWNLKSKGPAESPPLGERNAKSTLGLWKTAKTYIYMYIDKIFPKKTVETGVYSMLNG